MDNQTIIQKIVTTPGICGIFAKAGHGKSTLCANIIKTARKAGRPVVIVDAVCAFRYPSFIADDGIKIRTRLDELERWLHEPTGTVWVIDEIDCRIKDIKRKGKPTPYQMANQILQQCRQMGHTVIVTCRQTVDCPSVVMANAKFLIWGKITRPLELKHVEDYGLKGAGKLLPTLPRGKFIINQTDF
jgi:hypothetical protein